ncbi:uncharacterized protein LOC134840568 isoform X2 [Symsagittifera roscoffensis]|uniref:uncharacterized protein LOC134840568 isoform X2 n=1 Tax=Symsagittifera roscoffensis TaxID=84072 RepID=UPI00307C7380
MIYDFVEQDSVDQDLNNFVSTYITRNRSTSARNSTIDLSFDVSFHNSKQRKMQRKTPEAAFRTPMQRKTPDQKVKRNQSGNYEEDIRSEAEASQRKSNRLEGKGHPYSTAVRQEKNSAHVGVSASPGFQELRRRVGPHLDHMFADETQQSTDGNEIRCQSETPVDADKEQSFETARTHTSTTCSPIANNENRSDGKWADKGAVVVCDLMDLESAMCTEDLVPVFTSTQEEQTGSCNSSRNSHRHNTRNSVKNTKRNSALDSQTENVNEEDEQESLLCIMENRSVQTDPVDQVSRDTCTLQIRTQGNEAARTTPQTPMRNLPIRLIRRNLVCTCEKDNSLSSTSDMSRSSRKRQIKETEGFEMALRKVKFTDEETQAITRSRSSDSFSTQGINSNSTSTRWIIGNEDGGEREGEKRRSLSSSPKKLATRKSLHIVDSDFKDCLRSLRSGIKSCFSDETQVPHILLNQTTNGADSTENRQASSSMKSNHNNFTISDNFKPAFTSTQNPSSCSHTRGKTSSCNHEERLTAENLKSVPRNTSNFGESHDENESSGSDDDDDERVEMISISCQTVPVRHKHRSAQVSQNEIAVPTGSKSDNTVQSLTSNSSNTSPITISKPRATPRSRTISKGKVPGNFYQCCSSSKESSNFAANSNLETVFNMKPDDVNKMSDAEFYEKFCLEYLKHKYDPHGKH